MQKAKFQLSQIQYFESDYVLTSHTEKLRQVLSKTNFFNQSIQSDHMSVLKPLKQEKASVQGIELQVHLNYLMSIYENQEYLFLFFACKQDRESFNKQSKIVVWQFRKQNGQNRKLQIKGIKGTVSCMRLDRIGYLQKDKQDENKTVSRYKFCLIVGTVQGYLKVIEMYNDSSIRSMKLSTLNKIIQIIPFQRHGYELNEFYFMLLQGNQIHLINILNFDIMCRFCPRILPSKAQNALSISQSKSHPQYLYQSTKGGYIIVWQISNPKLHQNMKKSQQNKFRPINVVQTVFPRYLSHQLSLNGLLFMHIFGTLVLIVDKKCILKFFSINLDDRMDFIQVLKIQLPYIQSFNEMNLIEEEDENEKQKIYDEYFDNTFQNFKFSEIQQTLYFLLEKQKHSIYKLKLNQYMEFELLEKIKIKNKAFRKIEQFVVNEDGLFLIVRNRSGFAIKYFQDQDEQQQNQKDITNVSKSKDKRKHKQEEVQY